jgi:uncharacterized protein with HEPN domain
MDNEIKTWLHDILQAITDIESFFEKDLKHFNKYVSDLKTKRAVERELEIIGEAFNRIIKKDVNFQFDNIYKIIGTRNRIVHGYDSVSDDLIWSIVINHLPPLKIEVTEKLNQP